MRTFAVVVLAALALWLAATDSDGERRFQVWVEERGEALLP